MKSIRSLLTTALLAGSLVACDTAAPDLGAGFGADVVTDAGDAPASAETKLRHWEQFEAATAGQRLASVDFILLFDDSVEDPEAEAEPMFGPNAVRSRSYYRDGVKGASGTVPLVNLQGLLDAAAANPLVASIEPDLNLPIPIVGTLLQPILDTAGGILGGLLGGEGGMKWAALPEGEQHLPWGLAATRAPYSSARSGDGQGVVDVDVYVIDTAVEHPELNVVERVSFLDGEAPATADHGTHVAGVIAARDDAEGVVGIVPGARIHSLEVVGESGGVPLSRLVSAIEHVTAAKRAEPARPAVANISIGANVGTRRYNAFDNAVAAAVRAGVTVVVSAGNDARDASRYSPAHVTEALTVGSYGENGRFSQSFSNYGSGLDLLAPGADVLSTASEGRYAVMSGTSMAAPHVAGAAALYLAHYPAATPAEVRAALTSGARQGISGTPWQTTSKTVWFEGL